MIHLSSVIRPWLNRHIQLLRIFMIKNITSYYHLAGLESQKRCYILTPLLGLETEYPQWGRNVSRLSVTGTFKNELYGDNSFWLCKLTYFTWKQVSSPELYECKTFKSWIDAALEELNRLRQNSYVEKLLNLLLRL